MWPSDGAVTALNGRTDLSGDRQVFNRPGLGGKLSAGKTILGDIKEQHPSGRQFPLVDKEHEHDERTVLAGRPSQQTLQQRRPTPPPLHSVPERRQGYADLPVSPKYSPLGATGLGSAADTIVRSNSRGAGSRCSGAESPGMVESSAGSIGGGIGSHHGGWVGSYGLVQACAASHRPAVPARLPAPCTTCMRRFRRDIFTIIIRRCIYNPAMRRAKPTFKQLQPQRRLQIPQVRRRCS
jgi:hypothetical protein